jgi:hypothetical protein
MVPLAPQTLSCSFFTCLLQGVHSLAARAGGEGAAWQLPAAGGSRMPSTRKPPSVLTQFELTAKAGGESLPHVRTVHLRPALAQRLSTQLRQ